MRTQAPTRQAAHLGALLVLLFLFASAGFGCGEDGDEETTADEAEALSPRDLLTRARYTRLVIVVDWLEGRTPPPEDTRDRLARQMDPLVDKPDGVDVLLGAEASAPQDHDGLWTLEELETAMDAISPPEEARGAATIQTLLVDGTYAEDAATLGLAWGGHRLVIFQSAIQDLCATSEGAPPSGMMTPPDNGMPPDGTMPPGRLPSDRMAAQRGDGDTPRVGASPAACLALGVETRRVICGFAQQGVWIHELGHLLGLVGDGTPMVSEHRDPDHGPHDFNEDCVMYWAFERRDIVERLCGQHTSASGDDGASPWFDDACLADLAAARGE